MQQLHPSPPLFHTPRTLSGAFLALRNGDKVVWGRPATASTLCPLHTAGGMSTGRTGRDEHPLLIQRLTGPGGSVQILEGTGRLASAVSAVRRGRAGGCCWLHWCQISCSWELEMPRFRFFVWVYQACRAVTALCIYSCLSFSLQSSALHCPSGSSWPAPVILGLLAPSSHASVAQLCPGMAERAGMSSSPFTLPKLDKGYLPIQPGNGAQTPKFSQTHPCE